MDNYNKYKDTFQDVIISRFGVDKETNLPELCDDMDCRDCLFGEIGCAPQMEEWLNKDEDKYEKSSFMKKFTKLV